MEARLERAFLWPPAFVFSSPPGRTRASAEGTLAPSPPDETPGQVPGAPRRTLGVIEALVSARDQCPHAAVREHAARALEAVKAGGADTLREQAFLVLSTLAGWRGERADAVKRSLAEFVGTGAAARSPSDPQGRR
jgi:hypothetical protein